MGCAGFLRKCFIRISASGGPAADMGHCLLRITRSFHLLPPAYIILPFFIRFRRWCPKLFYSGFGICRKFLTLRPRGEIEEATTIANVFYFWLLTMQRGVFENSHHAMKSDYTKAWKHCQVEEELSSPPKLTGKTQCSGMGTGFRSRNVRKGTTMPPRCSRSGSSRASAHRIL